MNIDYIMNGPRNQKIPFDSKNAKPSKKPIKRDAFENLFLNKKKAPYKDPLRDLFIGKGNPIVSDRITTQQAKVFKGPSKDLFGDWDGDGVINALDCQPRNKSKHMAWKKPEAYQHIEYMAPREYLKKTNTGDFGTGTKRYGDSEKYYDKVSDKMEPIDKLSEHIKNPNVEVEIPFVDSEGEHEGRHRAYAAEKAGFKTIPVRTPPPESWRTKDVADTFTSKRFPHAGPDYRESWQKRIKRNPFPEDQMDLESRKAYAIALKEHNVITNPDQEVRDTIKQENET